MQKFGKILCRPQRSARGLGRQLQSTYYLAKFCQKLQENEENWTRGRSNFYYVTMPLNWGKNIIIGLCCYEPIHNICFLAHWHGNEIKGSPSAIYIHNGRYRISVGSNQPRRGGGVNLLFSIIFAKNGMKMKNIGQTFYSEVFNSFKDFSGIFLFIFHKNNHLRQQIDLLLIHTTDTEFSVTNMCHLLLSDYFFTMLFNRTGDYFDTFNISGEISCYIEKILQICLDKLDLHVVSVIYHWMI